jgi:hypothetical protein
MDRLSTHGGPGSTHAADPFGQGRSFLHRATLTVNETPGNHFGGSLLERMS